MIYKVNLKAEGFDCIPTSYILFLFLTRKQICILNRITKISNQNLD